MTRSEYTSRVLAVMRRVTAAEREAIRAELDAHMEDHMEALLDLGYEPDLAEQRTMERMGDPEEVGRALNAQYPLGWLILKRLAKVLTVVLALVLLTQVNWKNVSWNLRCRFDPNLVMSRVYEMDERYAFLEKYPADIRVQVAGTMVRICAVGVIPVEEYLQWGEVPEGTEYVAGIGFCAYPASWWDLGQSVSMPASGMSESFSGIGSSEAKAFYLVAVTRENTALTASYTLYGHDVSVDIPLDWEGVP